jgi:hypothetical protein
MVTRAHNFRHADIKRAFRAAEAAGVPNPVVRVVCKNGTELHIAGSDGKSQTPAKRQRASSRQPAR